MNSAQKNLVSAGVAFALAAALVFGFDVDLFTWIGDPQRLETSATITAEVIDVIDGDTFEVQTGTTTELVRLIGVDTPEIRWPNEQNNLSEPQAECLGWEARDALRNYILDDNVLLKSDSRQPDYDKYGRRLAYVFIDGVMVNERLLSEGLARELTVGGGYQMQGDFRRAEKSAQESKFGLWKACQ